MLGMAENPGGEVQRREYATVQRQCPQRQRYATQRQRLCHPETGYVFHPGPAKISPSPAIIPPSASEYAIQLQRRYAPSASVCIPPSVSDNATRPSEVIIPSASG